MKRKDHDSHRMMLAVRGIEHPHTGLAIRMVFDEVLDKWDIYLWGGDEQWQQHCKSLQGACGTSSSAELQSTGC